MPERKSKLVTYLMKGRHAPGILARGLERFLEPGTNREAWNQTQAPDREETLNIGRFSNAVFRVVAGFLQNDANRFVTEVEAIEV